MENLLTERQLAEKFGKSTFHIQSCAALGKSKRCGSARGNALGTVLKTFKRFWMVWRANREHAECVRCGDWQKRSRNKGKVWGL